MADLRPRPTDDRLREVPVKVMPSWIVRLAALVGWLLRRRQQR